MPADLDNTEMREHTARMKTAHGQIGRRGSQVVRAFTLRVEARAKVYCPVDTGHLVSTIASEFTGDGRFGAMSGTVVAGASYSRYVENGTSRMAGQPFMGPAFDQEIPGFEAACVALGMECAA